MDNANVIIRAVKFEDKAFILSTWLRGNYYGNDYFRQMPQDLYFKDYTEFINKVLYYPETKIDVAVLEDDPNTIFGFIVFQGPVIRWIYVKKDYRNKGIATLLIKDKNITSVSSTTKIGAAITKKLNLIFNPLI